MCTEQCTFLPPCLSKEIGFWLRPLSATSFNSRGGKCCFQKSATGVSDNLKSRTSSLWQRYHLWWTASPQRASAPLSPSLVNWLKLGISPALTHGWGVSQNHPGLFFCLRFPTLDFYLDTRGRHTVQSQSDVSTGSNYCVLNAALVLQDKKVCCLWEELTNEQLHQCVRDGDR